jgi:hypothetical protein
MAKRKKKDDAHRDEERERERRTRETDGDRNPPYTTTGPITAPMLGSAGCGGLENEPGPERD